MKHYLIASFNIVLILTIVTALFAAYIGVNPLTPNYGNAYALTKVVPEGWGFFTRNPREPMYRFYECNGEQFTEIEMNNNSLNSLIGLSRINRRVNLEFQRMRFLIPDSLYTAHAQNKQMRCDEDTIYTINDDRGFDYHFVKEGIYAVSIEKIKPWLYANKNIAYDQQYKLARIKFTNKKTK